MTKAYEWKPIEDLPDDWSALASSELGGLAAVWREHHETIKDSKALKQFNERLRREWAIETGIIENLYYIDRGVTLTLIEKGIEASLIPHGTTDKPAELIVPILKDQEEVVTGLFDFVGQQRQLSTSYIKQLHQALTQHQRTTAAKDSFGNMIEVELLRGEWKKLPNNPTKSDGSLHEYCPPEQVASEMDQLIAWHQEHLAKGIPPEVEAAWLHHRFTQIHPFQDGNGRMARTLASLIFLRAGLFPLVIHRDERDEYIDVLEKSDKKNLKVLIKFFAQTQKKAINQAINSAENVLLEDAPLEQIIQAGISTLKRRKLRILDEENNIDSNSILNSDYAIPSELLSLTDNKLREVAIQLRLQLQEVNPAIRVGVVSYSDEDCNQPDFEEYFEGLTSLPTLSRIVQAIAKNAGYSPNFRSFCAWSFLQIATGTDFEVILSFHAVSKSINNLIAVIAFLAPEVSLGKEWEFNETPAKPLNKEVFQITTEESEESIITRFNIWLDEAILNGLNYWQRQL